MVASFEKGLVTGHATFYRKDGGKIEDIKELPRELKRLEVRDYAFKGDIKDLPSNLEVLNMPNGLYLTGDLKDLKCPKLRYIHLPSSRKITGSLRDLHQVSKDLEHIDFGGLHEVTGDLKDLCSPDLCFERVETWLCCCALEATAVPELQGGEGDHWRSLEPEESHVPGRGVSPWKI